MRVIELIRIAAAAAPGRAEEMALRHPTAGVPS